MQPNAQHASATVLAYGTHDRSGPRWRRWGRAWFRAARPAAVAALIVAALAYAVAPRRYTAEARVDAELDWVSAARGLNSSPAMDAARADTLARSLKNTTYLNNVLGSPRWRHARLERPGKTLFDPIEAEPVPGTKTVRIRFTDPDPEMARVGAEAAVAALNPIDTEAGKATAESMQRHLGPMLREERALEDKLAAAREAAEGADPQRSAENTLTSLGRQLYAHRRRLTLMERSVGHVPRVRTAAPAPTTPRFASNARELVTISLTAAGLAFPLALLAALFHAWRFDGRRTVQEGHGQSATGLSDLVNRLGPTRPWRAAARLAIRPAGVAAVIAFLVAAWFTPRRYTATATVSGPLPAAVATAATALASTRPATATAAEAYAAVAGAATTDQVFSAVLVSERWRATLRDSGSPGGDAARGPVITAASDGASVAVRFTYADPDAARFGADAALKASLARVAEMPHDLRREVVMLNELRSAHRWAAAAAVRRGQSPGAYASPPADGPSALSAAVERYERLRRAAAQLPAPTPATVPRWPSNHSELATAGATAAAKAFGVVFMLAVTWFLRALIRESQQPGGAEVAGDAAAVAARGPLELAAALAVLVGLIAYVAAPRAYTATATLHVRAAPPRAEPPGAEPPGGARNGWAASLPPSIKLPSPAFVKLVEEETRGRLHDGEVRSDLAAGTVTIRYRASDPEAARVDAHTFARWMANRLPRPDVKASGVAFNAPPLRGPFAGGEPMDPIEELVANGAGQQVIVGAAAVRPRWADQFEPIRAAVIASTCTFVALFLGIDLLRNRRRPAGPPPLPRAVAAA